MAVLTNEQQQFLQDTGQTPSQQFFNGVPVQPAIASPVPVTSIQRSPFDAVNASPPQGTGPASGGKGSGRTTLPDRGIYSLFSPAYTPTVYNTDSNISGASYLDSLLKAGEDSRQTLGDLSRSIQPGSLVEGPVEEVQSDEDIRAPKAGAPIEEPEDDDDSGDD